MFTYCLREPDTGMPPAYKIPPSYDQISQGHL